MAALWVAADLAAQLGKPGKITGFRFPVFRESAPGKPDRSRTKTLITGAEARPQLDGLIPVTGMRLEDYSLPDGTTNLVAIAPHCIIDSTNRLVSSTGRLELIIAGGRILLEGRDGFRCTLTNLHLVVSNRVKTVIRPEKSETSPP
jgi:hypothetical protein